MLTKRELLETAAVATVAAAGTTPEPLLGQERVAQAATELGQSEEIRTRDAQSEEEWYYSVGIQNYVFTLPLTMLERERKVRLNPAALEKAKKFAPAAPLNQIGHMKTLATADDIMPYTPNNDTVYSGALLELADEPIILTAPDIPTVTGPSKLLTPIRIISFTSARADWREGRQLRVRRAQLGGTAAGRR